DKTGRPRKDNWDIWLQGGMWIKNGKMRNKNDDNPSGKVIGILKLIQNIRQSGAKNLLIVPGLSTEKSFKGVPMPLPTDPQGNVFESPINRLSSKPNQAAVGSSTGSALPRPSRSAEIVKTASAIQIRTKEASFHLSIGSPKTKTAVRKTSEGEMYCMSPAVE